MKRMGWVAAVLAIVVALIGCSGGDGGPPVNPVAVDIVSDARVDGDIDRAGVITTHSGTLLAGVDPLDGTEFRGFLSFPLTSVPSDADVQFASLEVFVLDLAPLLTTPFTFDLVSFSPPLLPTDFSDTSLPPILSRNFDVLPRDPGNFVKIDVTPMVREAFRRGLTDGQFRVLLDVRLTDGLMTLADPVSSTATAPILHIEYF
jgi:hypothetical protein